MQEADRFRNPSWVMRGPLGIRPRVYVRLGETMKRPGRLAQIPGWPRRRTRPGPGSLGGPDAGCVRVAQRQEARSADRARGALPPLTSAPSTRTMNAPDIDATSSI